ncbi:hypothetical protein ACQKJ1_16130 [Methylorubrum rhodesianum]|uniref:hypothetical protein n=1 Tax=Methylorubrum rhodesianum TaxID=29427 RepID=UPI003D041337
MKRRQRPSAEQGVLMSRQIGVQTAQGKSLALVCTEERTFGFAPHPVVRSVAYKTGKRTSAPLAYGNAVERRIADLLSAAIRNRKGAQTR